MRSKLNLKDKGQLLKPNEYTDNFKSNLTCIFLSVRAKLKKHTLPSDTVYIVVDYFPKYLTPLLTLDPRSYRNGKFRG